MPVWGKKQGKTCIFRPFFVLFEPLKQSISHTHFYNTLTINNIHTQQIQSVFDYVF